jgi:Transposase DDE domain
MPIHGRYSDMEPRYQASQNIGNRLTWQTANRDQTGIAASLAAGEDIPEVYALGEASLFDEFFCFLEHFGIDKLFGKLDPLDKKRKSKVPFMGVIYIYLMRIIAGLQFFWHIDPVILHSQSLMRLVGFNGREVRDGTCNRGIGQKSSAAVPKPEESEQTFAGETDEDSKQPTKIRGPVCPDYIASRVCAILGKALEKLFNKTITILATHKFFPKKIHVILDASEIESTEKCTGCGKVSKEKAPELRLRQKRIRKVVETVFGFKIWVVWDPNSRLPLAIRFATIEVADIQLAQEVIQQALDNLGDHATIVSIAIDRGFMDGKLLWWLNGQGITFFIPAKSNMDVYKDALSLIPNGTVVNRIENRTKGAGKNKVTVTDSWELVAIEGLTSAGFYGPLGSGSHQHSNAFRPNPINAVVVVSDPFCIKNPNSDTMIILTNGSVEKPFDVYDGYDARSEIENGFFREAKQAWFIERPPKNTKNGFQAHVFLTILLMALTTAFRAWMEQQEKMERKGHDTGARKFREQVREENGNKLIIFDEDRYAIFDAYEVFILCDRNVRMPRGIPEKITKDDILRKYGAILE